MIGWLPAFPDQGPFRRRVSVVGPTVARPDIRAQVGVAEPRFHFTSGFTLPSSEQFHEPDAPDEVIARDWFHLPPTVRVCSIDRRPSGAGSRGRNSGWCPLRPARQPRRSAVGPRRRVVAAYPTRASPSVITGTAKRPRPVLARAAQSHRDRGRWLPRCPGARRDVQAGAVAGTRAAFSLCRREARRTPASARRAHAPADERAHDRLDAGDQAGDTLASLSHHP